MSASFNHTTLCQPDHARMIRIIRETIKALSLDLSGYTILTEAGSGSYLYTPIIAALAGARRVYAWTRDSAYGSSTEITAQCMTIANELGVSSVIVCSNERPAEHAAEADIITNLGFVRPLDSELLRHCRSDKTVIPVMCEAWETRPSDIDLSFCRAHGIRVAGTWENHPELKIFDGCGPLAIKMAMAAGYEVYQNNIIIWSNDHFGEVISRSFQSIGANKVTMTTETGRLYELLHETDFIFLADYDEQRTILGDNGLLDVHKLKSTQPAPGIVHLYGKVSHAFLQEHGIPVYPAKDGRASVMTYTLSHLGPIPMVRLHTAGLKVGECLKKNLRHPLVQIIK